MGLFGVTTYVRMLITIGEKTAIGGNVKILENYFYPIELEKRNKILDDENGGYLDLVLAKEDKRLAGTVLLTTMAVFKKTVIGDGCVVGTESVLDKLILCTEKHHLEDIYFIPYQDKEDLIYSLMHLMFIVI